MKFYTWIGFSALMIFPITGYSQDTVAGWTFPTGAGTEVFANFGTPGNVSQAKILAADTLGNLRTITFTNGVTAGDYAATTTSWDNGDSIKYWQVSLSTLGYEDLVLDSKQRSGSTNPGPKFFRLQFRIGSGMWEDIPAAGLVTVGNDWTTGVVSGLSLPVSCENVSDTVYLRWLMITNEGITGAPVAANGTTKLDDIFITGIPSSTSVEQNPTPDFFDVFPSVSGGLIQVSASEAGSIQVFNLAGQLVYSCGLGEGISQLDLSSEPQNFYLLRWINSENRQLEIRKLFIIH